jgi:hypothetical protein
MLWIKVVQNSDVTFICALYHSPSPIYNTTDLLDAIGNISTLTLFWQAISTHSLPSGLEEAATIAVKIGAAIKQYNSAEFSRVDVLNKSRAMWTKVRKLAGQSKALNGVSVNTAITASSLNDQYDVTASDLHTVTPGKLMDKFISTRLFVTRTDQEKKKTEKITLAC